MNKSIFFELYEQSSLYAQFRAALFGVSQAQIDLWVLQARANLARSIC